MCQSPATQFIIYFFNYFSFFSRWLRKQTVGAVGQRLWDVLWFSLLPRVLVPMSIPMSFWGDHV